MKTRESGIYVTITHKPYHEKYEVVIGGLVYVFNIDATVYPEHKDFLKFLERARHAGIERLEKIAKI